MNNLLNCPICNAKGEYFSYICGIQNLELFRAKCSKSCKNNQLMTFAVKNRELANELWNSAARKILQ